MKKVLVAAALCILTCSTAIADRWYISSLSDKEVRLENLDSIAKHGAETRGWVATVNINKSLPYDLELTMFHANCAAGTVAISAVYNYLKGTLKKTANKDRVEIGYPPPGSIADTIAKVLCKPDDVDEGLIANIDDIKKETPKLQDFIREMAKLTKQQ